MANARQIVKMPAPDLTPEFREFLDRVVVPALVKKYFTEGGNEKESENRVAVPPFLPVTCASAEVRRAK
jgi:hypothetical protein